MKLSGRKICFIANSGFTIVNFRSELIKTLVKNDCIVTVVCPIDCGLMQGRSLREELDLLGAKYVSVAFSRSGVNPISELQLLKKLFFLLREIKPDVVLNYTIKPTIYGSIAAKLSGIKYIASNITGLGFVFTSDSFSSFLLSTIIKLQYKLALRCNNLVFFQNPDDEALFKSFSLTNSVKTKVINGSGVDTEKFLRRNFNATHCSFIFVGRLLRDKGVHEFVQAAKKLKLKYPDAVFTILGPVDDNPSAFSKRELDLYVADGTVNYLEPRPDVRNALEEHEVFVLPSYREGTPRSILEAMSMSMPIVTTDVPGCRETVIDGKNGLLVEVKNIESLAASMEKFIVDRQLIQCYGDCSRLIACERYDVRKVNESIISELL